MQPEFATTILKDIDDTNTTYWKLVIIAGMKSQEREGILSWEHLAELALKVLGRFGIATGLGYAQMPSVDFYWHHTNSNQIGLTGRQYKEGERKYAKYVSTVEKKKDVVPGSWWNICLLRT